MRSRFAEVAGRLMEETACEAVGLTLYSNSKTGGRLISTTYKS